MKPPVKINDDISVAWQIEPSDVADLAAQGFRTIINNRPDGEEPGQPSSAEVRAAAEKAGMKYVMIPVAGGVMDRATVAAFDKALKDNPGPVLAHCRSGTRSHFLWALIRVVHHKDDPAKLIAEAGPRGYDLSPLPTLISRLG